MLSHPTCPLDFETVDALLDAARKSGAKWPDWLGEEIDTHDHAPAGGLWHGRVFVTARFNGPERRLRYTIRLAAYGQFSDRIMAEPVGRLEAFTDPVAAHVAASAVGALHAEGFIPLALHPADRDRIARAAGFPDDAR